MSLFLLSISFFCLSLILFIYLYHNIFFSLLFFALFLFLNFFLTLSFFLFTLLVPVPPVPLSFICPFLSAYSHPFSFSYFSLRNTLSLSFSTHLSVCLSVCLSTYLSLYLSLSLVRSLSAISSPKNVSLVLHWNCVSSEITQVCDSVTRNLNKISPNFWKKVEKKPKYMHQSFIWKPKTFYVKLLLKI